MSLLSLPDQTVPESKKNEEWHKEHARNFATFTTNKSYNDQRELMKKYYRAYNAELDDKEMKLAQAITCPNGTDLGVEYIVYPLIQTKVEQLIGEYTLRPLKKKSHVLDKKSKHKKFQKKLQLLSEELMRDVVKKISPDLGFDAQTKDGQVELPPDVEEFMSKDFKTLAEETADAIVELLYEARKEKQKLPEMLKDFCIVDRCHAVLEKKNSHPSLRKVHPMDADYDIDPYKIVQDDHEYFFESYYLTENEIYNTFSLTKTQKEEVKKIFASGGSTDENDSYDSDDLKNQNRFDGWYRADNSIGRVRVVSAMWKSLKRVPIKKSTSKKTGETFYKKLKDETEVRNNDEVEYIEGEIPRHVIMLGPDICLSWGKMDKRFSSVDNIYKCTLPVVSVIRDNATGSAQIKSISAKLYQLQQLASEVLFEIRLAIKHMADSRVLIYDVAQTPSDFTKGGYEAGLNRVMHHIKKDKMLFINSKEKSFRGNFNQFSSLDLSQKGSIQDMFNGLAIIEDLASKFAGISPEREGNVGQYQTATGAQQAISGSTARTEVIFSPFDDFVQCLTEKLLKRAQHDYEEGEVLQYVIGEMKTKFLKLFKEFFFVDLGIYLTDGRREKEMSEKIDQAAQLALSNSNTPEMVMGLIEIFEEKNPSGKKAVFQRMLNAMAEMRAQNQKAAQEAAAAEQAEKDKDREIDLTKAREGNQTEKEVAHIYADNKANVENTKASSQERIKAAELAKNQKEPATN